MERLKVSIEQPSIPPAQPKGEAQVICENISKKKLSLSDALFMTAMHIGLSVEDHPARPYPSPREEHGQYVVTRFNGFRARDQSLAVENGVWLEVVRRIACANKKDQEMLSWAKTICAEQESDRRIVNIDCQLMLHQANEFPIEFYTKALEVQAKDSDERRRNLGGA